MNRIWTLVLLSCALLVLTSCTKTQDEIANKTLILSTTTSTQDSGLLDYLLGDFTEKTGIEVKVVAVGSGKALQMGKDGEADVLLVHAKSAEEAFVSEGYGTARFDVMYNDFILVGPSDDPANLQNLAPNDALVALKTLYDTNTSFISRGDDSGTHKKELELWKATNLDPTGKPFYVSAGKGMGDVLLMADELLGYTLTDRATYLSMRKNLQSIILTEKDESMNNQYGIIPVNPDTNELINHKGALKFVEWILSKETQERIGNYGVDTYGMPLFVPNAK
jgi:tungstate transport system substrate-binding protein